ncbi:hypothetical protein AQS8620_01261 [Aquimixticola soesokkakensis]|uniref:Uncharacterized protein n=1 Tax=Aquimixticola soesokkakensis TaxID=1519096 RepID=A0A1Y5S9Y3_9RHOB|nr:hypothetical protein AQS8620_01261 [Aquimixticola soesokkakensis]
MAVFFTRAICRLLTAFQAKRIIACGFRGGLRPDPVILRSMLPLWPGSPRHKTPKSEALARVRASGIWRTTSAEPRHLPHKPLRLRAFCFS